MANKNITQVEEIEALDGTEKVFVSSNGSLKQIKTENAKFGGGGGGAKTIFYAAYSSQVATQAAVAKKDVLCKDINCTQVATAQEIYNAWANGEIWIDYTGSNELFLATSFMWLDSSGQFTDPTDVIYCVLDVGSFYTGDSYRFKIGTNPESK